MKASKKTIIVLLLFLYALLIHSQDKVLVYGTVRDDDSGEAIPNAMVVDTIHSAYTLTNIYGNYSLSIPMSQNAVIKISSLAYKTKYVTINTITDTLLPVKLEAGIELQEFKVVSQSKFLTNNSRIGKILLNKEMIESIPCFAGESNLVEAIKLMPGVSSGKEGKSELYVRGGGYDQNLILLDKSPVYNLNHAFGLFSIFNSSTIKDVSFYKGGIPAQYGGHLSSVLDVGVREGNRQEYKAQLVLSSLAASVTAEGPIIKNKMSFLASIRRTWPDLLVLGMVYNTEGNMIPGYSFLDVNLKTNYTLKEKHHFYLSYYTGCDNVFFLEKTNTEKCKIAQGWGNTIASARYQSISSDASFNDVLLYYSTYYENDYTKIETEEKKSISKYQSNFYELGLKSSKEWTWGFFKSKVGVEFSSKRFILPHYTVNDFSKTDITDGIKEYQNDMVAYSQVQYTHDKWNVIAGLHSHLYENDEDYNYSFEPRLSISYHYNDNLSFKGGTMKTSQSVFAFSKSSMASMGYVWLPVSDDLDLMTCWQTSFGTVWRKNKWLFDIEGYYKILNNVIGSYGYSTKVFSYTTWNDYMQQGKGLAYGIDLLSQYVDNHLTVSLKYSLSKSEVVFPEINNGKWFPSNYDIRHDIALTGNWTFKETAVVKRGVSGTFVLHSPAPLTLPTQSIPFADSPLGNVDMFCGESSINYYDSPNNARNLLYHRLDLNVFLKKTLEKGDRTWNFGVLNVYNRQNPYWIYTDEKTLKQVVLFPIMPVISYKRNF